MSAARRRGIQERIDMYLGNVHLAPAHRRHRAQERVAQRSRSIRDRIAAEGIHRQEFDRFRNEVQRETAWRAHIANFRFRWVDNKDNVIQEFQPLRNARSSAGTPGVLE